MDTLVKFVDSYIENPQHYRVPHLYKDSIVYEVVFSKGKYPWRFRQVGELFWIECTSNTITTQLDYLKLDMDHFEESLKRTIFETVISISYVLEAAQSLFGKKVLDEIQDQHRLFVDTLVTSLDNEIVEELEKPTKNNLKLVEDDKQD